MDFSSAHVFSYISHSESAENVADFENMSEISNTRAYHKSSSVDKRNLVPAAPKTIDADWLRAHEVRLLHQSDVVLQRLHDLNQEPNNKTYTAYHGISYPRRKPLESQVALIQLRKKRQDEAIAQHQARRAILKFVEAWRIRTIHKYHYLACKKKAKMHRLKKAITYMLDRCVFTCKAQHSLAVVGSMYDSNQCRKSVQRLQFLARASRKFARIQTLKSSQQLAWNLWRSRFFDKLSVRMQQMEANITAYNHRLTRSAKPFLKQLYSFVQTRKCQHKKLLSTLRRNGFAGTMAVEEFSLSHDLARCILQWRRFMYRRSQERSSLLQGMNFRVLVYLKLWRRRTAIKKQKLFPAISRFHRRSLEVSFSLWRMWLKRRKQSSFKGTRQHNKKSAALYPYFRRLCEKVHTANLARHTLQRCDLHVLEYRKKQLFSYWFSLTLIRKNICHRANRKVSSSHFGSRHKATTALDTWRRRSRLCLKQQHALTKASRYCSLVGVQMVWSLWITYRERILAQRVPYQISRSQFYRSGACRFFNGFYSWRVALVHLRGMEDIGQAHWERRMCSGLFETLAVRVHTARSQTSSAQIKAHQYGSYCAISSLKRARRHYSHFEASKVVTCFKSKIRARKHNDAVDRYMDSWHLRFLARKAFSSLDHFIKQRAVVATYHESDAELINRRALEKSLKMWRVSSRKLSQIRKRFKAISLHHDSYRLARAFISWTDHLHTGMTLKRLEQKADSYCRKRMTTQCVTFWRESSVARNSRKKALKNYYTARNLRRDFNILRNKAALKRKTFDKLQKVITVPNALVYLQYNNFARKCIQYSQALFKKTTRVRFWKRLSWMFARRRKLRGGYMAMRALREARIKRKIFAALLWHSVNESSDNSLIRTGVAFRTGKMTRKYFDDWALYNSGRARSKALLSFGQKQLARHATTRAFKLWHAIMTDNNECYRRDQEKIRVCLQRKYISKLLRNVRDRKQNRSVETVCSQSRAHVATKSALGSLQKHVVSRKEQHEVWDAAKRYHLRLFLLQLIYKLHIRSMYSKMNRRKVGFRDQYLLRYALKKLKWCRGGAQRDRVNYATVHYNRGSKKGAIRTLSSNCATHYNIRKGWAHFKYRRKFEALYKWDRSVDHNKQQARLIEKLLATHRHMAKMRKGIIGLQYYAHTRTRVKAVSLILLRRYFRYCKCHRSGKRFMRLALTKITMRSRLKILKYFNEWKENTVVERTLDVALARKSSYQKYIVMIHWRQLISWKRDDKAYKSHMIDAFIGKRDVIFQHAFFRRLRRLIRYRNTNQRMAKRAGKISLQKLFDATRHQFRCRRRENQLEHKAHLYYYKSMLSLGVRFLQFQVASNKSNTRVLRHNERRHKHSMLRSAVRTLWFNAAQARKLRVLKRNLLAYMEHRKKLVALQIFDGIVASKWASQQSLRMMDVQYRKMALIRGVKGLFHHARHRNYQRRRRMEMR